MSTDIFRKTALERLSSPEQLDLLMQITTPRGWVALLALGCLICCAVIWTIWGSIPTRISGHGILMKTGGVSCIVPTSTGRVQNLYFKMNDVVRKGQIVARIEQPESLDRINNARAVLQEMEAKYRQIAGFGTEHMKLEKDSMGQQRANLEHANNILGERVAWLHEKTESQEQLARQGLITKQQYLNSRQELNAAKQEIDKNRNMLQQLSIRELELKNQKQQELSDIAQKISEAKRNIQQLQDDYDDLSKVVSPYTGRILEIAVTEGTVVSRGSAIMNIELLGKEIKNLEAVIYFPPSEGKKIQPGMRAQVCPSTIKQEEYGFMLGMVTYVSEFPASFQVMMRTLQNESLVKSLSGGEAPIEVRADLIPDPRTPSGYRWSSSQGPPLEIRTGTVAFAMVTVSEQAPIDLAVPFLKRHLLGIGEGPAGAK